MRTSIARTLSLAALAVVLVGGVAQAQGRGKGHGHGHDDDRDDRGHANGQGQGRGWGNGAVPPGLQKNGVPPGLAKKGGLPPGQAKKMYRPDDGVSILRDVFGQHGYHVVRTAPHGTARYVYYRYPDGSLHRAIVSPGADRLSFSNVPSVLLQQILARLY